MTSAQQGAILPNASRVVSLLEAVVMEDLMNDEEYNDILEDMRDECGKYGKVR